jgi:hypothetical protein
MKIRTLILFVLLAIAIVAILQVDKLRKENNLLKTNQETLLSDIERYKIDDSINAARIGELNLSLSEYKKYRAEDAALIKKLKADKLAAVSNVKIETKIEQVPVTIHDTIYKQAQLKAFDYKSKWTDVSGIIMPDSVLLDIANREELIITESFQKKKFWFIKLPAWLFGYKSKKIDIISKNPNTEVVGAEFIMIK